MTNILWIVLIIIMLILSFKIGKFINFNNYKFLKMLKVFKGKNKQGLFLSLGAKIGVGSIIGTTISIYLGGPGSVFWLFLFSFLTSSLIYYESYLGNKNKEKLDDGSTIGGPYFYIKKALKNKKLAIISMVILILCYSLLFQMIQTNTITHILQINFNLNPIIVAAVLFFILIFLIFFSLKELVNSMSKLVPIMCIVYLALGLFCIIKNLSGIQNILISIFTSAFTKRGIMVGLVIGVKRAIFLNEIMIGTASIGSGTDEDLCPSQSGYIQTLGVYFVTFIVSFITSILVLLFKENNIFFIANYNELISEVFKYHFGAFGGYILTLIIFLFALTTILSGYYIGESNLGVITKSKKPIFVFKIFMLLFCICGVYLNSEIIWKLVDALMYILILINSYAIYCIYKGEKNDRQ